MSDTVSIDYYADLNPSRAIPDNIRNDSLVSFIPMSDVSEAGHWTYRQSRKFSEVSSGFTNFKDSDVLVAKITPCFENGKGAIVKGLTNGVGFGSTEFHVLRARNGVSPEFIFHIAQWPKFRKEARRYMIGSAGQQRVQRLAFSRCRLGDFGRSEQKMIANILDTLDTQIRQTEAIIAKLQQVKQGLLHDLLTRGIDANGQLRPPREQAPELYKESPLGWIPREWAVSDLQSISSKIVDGTHFTPTYTESGIPFLRVTNVQSRVIDPLKTKYISRAEHELLTSRCAPQRGDILLSKNGTVGIAKLVDWDWEFSIFVSLAMIRLSTIDKTSPDYITWVLNSHVLKLQIQNRSKQGTVTNLHLEEIREFLIPLPTVDEQKKITAAISIFEAKLFSEEKTLGKLKKQKSGLMNDLLTGRVRVTELLKTA